MSRPPPSSLPVSACLPTARQIVIVAVFTALLSWLLHALSRTPYIEVFSRIGFIGAALLTAYAAAGGLHPRWLGRTPARLAALVLTAPLAVLATAVAAQGGNVFAYLREAPAMASHVFMTVLAIVLGVPFALVALRGERKARERADRLQAAREKDRLERELLDARLRMLQAQIEPHFLFNTLANVEALVASNSPNAGPVLRHLIAYLRAAMPRLNDAQATLQTELQLVRSYLELMQLRMPDRLQFSVAEPALAATLRFPAMALLTLVENAVRHGIDPAIEGGRIDVGARRDEATGGVVAWVADTGVGMAETAQPGTGLSNLRTRIKAWYGDAARVDLHETAPHGLRVELHLPAPHPGHGGAL
jgi:signal transduction histidine kinase